MTDNQSKWCLMPDFRDAHGTLWNHRISFPDAPGVMPTNQRREVFGDADIPDDERDWKDFNLTEMVDDSVKVGIAAAAADEQVVTSIILPDFTINGQRYNRKFDGGYEKFKRDDTARWSKFHLDALLKEVAEDAIAEAGIRVMGTFAFSGQTMEWGVDGGNLYIRPRVYDPKAKSFEWNETSMDRLLTDHRLNDGVLVDQEFTYEPGLVFELGHTKTAIVCRHKNTGSGPDYGWEAFNIQQLLGDSQAKAFEAGKKAEQAVPTTDFRELRVRKLDSDERTPMFRLAYAVDQVVQHYLDMEDTPLGHVQTALSFVMAGRT